jgi:outer membrane protein assembly factor BamB
MVRWEWSAGQEVAVPVVADDRTLFVGLVDGRLAALSARDGTEHWSWNVPGVLDAAPSVAGDRLFVGLRSGEVVALDTHSGAVLWRADTGRSVSATPIVSEGRVFVAANGLMLALDAEDGRELWRDSVDDSLMTVTPALDGGRLAVATFGRVLLFDVRNGEQRSWFRFAPQQAPSLSVAVVQATIVASSSGLVVAIDSDMTRPWWDGVRPAWQALNWMGAAPAPPWNPELWSADAPRNAYPAVVGEEQVIVAGRPGTVRAYALRSGTLRWERRMPPVSAPPVIVDGGVLLAGRNSITIIDSADGMDVTRRTLDSLTPTQVVVSDSGVFVVGERGRIVALR